MGDGCSPHSAIPSVFSVIYKCRIIDFCFIFALLSDTTFVIVAGAIFDTTQSYTLSFIVSGGLIAIAGFIGLPVRRVAAWEGRKWGSLGGETDYTVVPHEPPQK